ncbi:hypothetical protein [Marinivivus vitaminiproducens]|uniref:hypothetical protein n=1 Tax=Marinivivus vitaminiproducens TaxID=3035935 RepID=UPI0027A7C67A|nr:hypothetical protein P4R82_20335 [Geminicoccaceae bacterium SCSIO 64248]
MYDKNDPRASLASAATAGAPPQTGLIAEPQLGLFYEEPPALDDDSGRTWFHRGCNFVTAWSEAAPRGSFARTGQIDEYAVLLPERGHSARITWNGAAVDVPGYSVAFVPPGDSRIEMPDGGPLTRLVTVRSADLAARASNGDAYAAGRAHIPPFTPWPEPSAGWNVRHYSLDVAKKPGRFGRIFRCTTFMVNFLDANEGPRDTTRLSPHHHDDFEQLSLAVAGSFTHHLRWPWTIDMADWRDDRHDHVRSPSAYVIPPPVIHTTRAMDAGTNQLVDIFCPPRLDFSMKPGWVLNADDYPMPTDA